MKNLLLTNAAIGLLLFAGIAYAQAVENVKIRATRTILVSAPGLGVDKVCVTACAAPDVALACVEADAAANGQEIAIDVTSLMQPGVPACFQAVSVSPEGLQSVASANSASGTIPAAPVLR
jgi:hypothetical protein